MKITDKKKPISAIPEGVWEASRTDLPSDGKAKISQSTDLQGNGYPLGKMPGHIDGNEENSEKNNNH